jgi:hypothetical protein
MAEAEKNNDLQTFKQQFNRAVRTRQWSMIRERIVPRVMPPMMVGSAFAATLLLNMWEQLPPQGRMIGMIAFAGAAIVSPFINRVGSPIVGKRTAIREIDKSIGSEDDMPARDFSDVRSDDERTERSPMWEAHKKQVWNRWGDKIKDQKNQSGFKPYYFGENKARAPIHAAIAFAAAGLFIPFGENLNNNWQTAMDWTVPLPPLVYHASITPPERIEGVQVFTDMMIKSAIEGNQPLSPHESSTLSIITYDRPAIITVNGQTIEPVSNEEDGTRRVRSNEISYTYEIELSTDVTAVSVDEFNISLNILPDHAPNVRIERAEPDRNNPSSLRLDYSIADDHGATGADARITIRGNDGTELTPVLPSNTLPSLTLPYE